MKRDFVSNQTLSLRFLLLTFLYDRNHQTSEGEETGNCWRGRYSTTHLMGGISVPPPAVVDWQLIEGTVVRKHASSEGVISAANLRAHSSTLQPLLEKVCLGQFPEIF